MNSRITKSVLVLSLVGLSTSLFAQNMNSDTTKRFDKKDFRTWSIGLNGGMLTHYTPFNNRANGDFSTPQESWGYGGYIKKQILPGFGIQADFLAGKVKGLRANIDGTTQQNTSFETRIDWSAAVSGNFTIANMSLNHKRSVLSPYLTAGAGYMSSSAKTNAVGTLTTPAGSTGYGEHWFIPVGAGLKFGLSKGVNLDLGYTVNFMKTNNFDGVQSAANDKFTYAHAGVEIAIGKRGTSQLQNFSAIAAVREESAAESSELRRALSTSEQNRLRDQEQYAKDMGDEDGDGVANKFDKCPGTPANTVVDGAGCPLRTQKQIIKEKVIVTAEDRRVVDEAIRNLEFDLSKATIRATSYNTLNRVAALLVEKNFSLKLAGHTDNTGSMALNLRLSKDRAEAIKTYLVSQGANASRIEATGYGPNQPIASNKTAAGRQKNRRVEFSLF
ncbi:OmpA family protein [Pedobacter sp. PAMC26386]|nr:OmpA family protein [Pedobacter sp. PAMC26386]